jgi:polyhydroxybutyrate depolymerase
MTSAPIPDKPGIKMVGVRSRTIMLTSAVALLLLAAACSSTPSTPSASSGADEATTTVAPPPPTVAHDPELADGVIDIDGMQRTYHLHVPSSLPAGQPVPLLVGLHGGLGSGQQFEGNSQFDRFADEKGFIVVYPDGIGGTLGRDNARTWNAGYCCGKAALQQVDDVSFISDVIDEVSAAYPIDPTRVYAAGHSNGGIMSYRLACELSDKIVAVGVVAGSLGVDSCTPAQPVSLIHIHGTADKNHPIDGGVGENSLSATDFHSARSSVDRIVALDQCPASPSVANDGDVTTTTWSPCADDTAVEYVVIDGASHAWMGGAGDAYSGPAYQGYDASAQIVDFLLAHPRGGGAGSR